MYRYYTLLPCRHPCIFHTLGSFTRHKPAFSALPPCFTALCTTSSPPSRRSLTCLRSYCGENHDAITYDIDISQIKVVPILRTVLFETLRHYASGTGTRVVVEDTILDGHYFLKKGSFVFMPNRIYHFNASVRGPSVDEFDGQQFIKAKASSGSFRAFGGGVNLCPGRFFITNQIMAVSSMLALR